MNCRVSLVFKNNFYTIGLKNYKWNFILYLTPVFVLSLDIMCEKCGEKVITMKMLKPIKKAMQQFSNRCTHCGMLLSVTDFSVDVEK